MDLTQIGSINNNNKMKIILSLRKRLDQIKNSKRKMGKICGYDIIYDEKTDKFGYKNTWQDDSFFWLFPRTLDDMAEFLYHYNGRDY